MGSHRILHTILCALCLFASGCGKPVPEPPSDKLVISNEVSKMVVLVDGKPLKATEHFSIESKIPLEISGIWNTVDPQIWKEVDFVDLRVALVARSVKTPGKLVSLSSSILDPEWKGAQFRAVKQFELPALKGTFALRMELMPHFKDGEVHSMPLSESIVVIQ